MKRFFCFICSILFLHVIYCSALAQNKVPVQGKINGHDWVDLGLSVKWATCNIGASSPSDYGDYFAWGETQTKDYFSWANYKYHISGDSWENLVLNKYVTKEEFGDVDNMCDLEKADDAAIVNWGGSWRMPTKSEIDELRNGCDWEWSSQFGIKGYKVTSKTNGNSIFLPAAGCMNYSTVDGEGMWGYYWASSINPSYPNLAYDLGFYSQMPIWNNDYNRCTGYSIRPVTD